MGYKKLASTSSQRTNLISTHFFAISQKNKTLNDFHSPKVFTMFPTSREPQSKTLNPKVTSFDFSSFPLLKLYLKNELQHLNSDLILSKSCRDCQNRVMIDVYDPRYNNLIVKTCQACQKSCHDCSKSCHDCSKSCHN